MAKRMLIDATHAEETRVVVLDGNRLEDFDVETSTKRQLKGNIYLAKVVRVEPSLQAAFVEYGGNRHGFLAFSEIHPDYYQIPVADRQRLLELQAEEARLEEEEEDLELALNQAVAPPVRPASPPPRSAPAASPATSPIASPGASPGASIPEAEAWAHPAHPGLLAPEPAPVAAPIAPAAAEAAAQDAPTASATEAELTAESWALPALPALTEPDAAPDAEPTFSRPPRAQPAQMPRPPRAYGSPRADDDQPDTGPRGGSEADDMDMFGSIPEEAPPETVGGDSDGDSDNDAVDERPERRLPPRFLRNYHIQEVIHRRQILLVQVVKEERGTKGAALTTYLSLAGRFSVLMPNSPRGGGISRKITSPADRRRLKEIMAEVDLPKGMGLIVRTAGAQRPKPEIKRDCEYLLRLWDDIREHTMKSIAPAMIYEEASLIKRAIRDVYSRDIDDITVDGEAGWQAAHEFMRMLMPSHARKVIHWPDEGQSLFARFQVEAQLDSMLQPTVQLRSGGYLVIDQAEALVAIDVNSGRSTRERNVEETAVRTNLEAADEVARQLRLRDLAGLIVIDFIDMESKRHNAMVERRLKDALKNDRARIQVGHISHFGLLEMSRQRLRPSLEETTLVLCAHCNGTGHVRGTESAALHVLRGVEEEAGKRRSAEVIVHVATPIALYILNHKRERLNEIERRYGMRVVIAADDSMIAPRFRIERLRAVVPGEEPRFVTPDAPRTPVGVPVGAVGVPMLTPPDTIEAEEEDEADDDVEEPAGEDLGGEDGAAEGGTPESREAADRRRRRRRRRRGGRDGGGDGAGGRPGEADSGSEDAPLDEAPARRDQAPAEPLEAERPLAARDPAERDSATPPSATEEEANRRRRRRGGRRRREEDGDLSPLGVPGAEQPDLTPAYSGPTPADPFGSGHVFDIFDVMEQAELNAAPVRRAPAGRRGPGGRSRWQPPLWAVAEHPPMLVPEPAADGADRGPQPESWALPSRPFMLRRDRHTPRWARQRGMPPLPETRAPATPETVAPGAAANGAAPPAATPEIMAPPPGATTAPAPEGMSQGLEVWASAGEPPLVVPDLVVPDLVAPNLVAPDLVAPIESAPAQPVPAQPVPERPAPRVRQPRAARDTAEAATPAAGETPSPAARAPGRGRQRAVPIEAGPPPEPVAEPMPIAETAPSASGIDNGATPAEPAALIQADAGRTDTGAAPPVTAPAPAEAAPVPVAATPEPAPVPANDATPPAPAIQPILVGSEATPPVERKKGWWRR